MSLVASHRGGNSWDSLYTSVSKGYDYAELDVHLTQDGEVVVQYSPTVTIDDTPLYIKNLSYKDLSVEDKTRLLLFSDVLKFAKDRIGIVVDVKKGSYYYPGIGNAVASIIKQNNAFSYTWLISFDHKCLVEAKQYDPRVRIAPMYVARLANEAEYLHNLSADGVEICTEYLDAISVKTGHDNNIVLIGWCANNIHEAKLLVELGIDIVTLELDDVESLEYLSLLKKEKVKF